MPRYSGDPYWLKARRSSHCSGCNGPIVKGQAIYYYPNIRKAYGSACGCGQTQHQQFMSAAADEDVYAGTGNPYAS